MKQGHAECSASNSGAGRRVVAGFAKASGATGGVELIRRRQTPLCAQEHSFVVNWELQEWSASEQDWFPKGGET